MTIWGFNQYIVRGRYTDLINGTVFQLVRDSGARALLLWQHDFNTNRQTMTEAQIINAAQLCKQHGLDFWLVLKYDVAAARSIVAQLGDLCNHYEVCKEPHISGYCKCSATDYPKKWRDVVVACRQVNPRALYGGPVAGRPRTRRSWFTEWLTQCKDLIDPANTFISYHWYAHYSGRLPSQTTLTQNAPQIQADVKDLKQLCKGIVGRELPVALTEFNWTADPNVTRLDQQTTFMAKWTKAAMKSCLAANAYAAFFWNLGGVWENTMSIIKPAPAYIKKPQYNAIKEYLQSVSGV